MRTLTRSHQSKPVSSRSWLRPACSSRRIESKSSIPRHSVSNCKMGEFKRSCRADLVKAEDFPRSTIKSHFSPAQGPEHGESSGWTRRVFKNQEVRPTSLNAFRSRCDFSRLPQSAQEAADCRLNLRRPFQYTGCAVPHDFPQVAAPGFRHGNVERLSCTVPKPIFITFRTQAQINNLDSVHVTGFGHNPQKQALAGGILFLTTVKGRLIPKPTSMKLKPIIPCDRLFPHHQHAQSHDLTARKSPGEFFKEEAAFGCGENASALRRLEARHVRVHKFGQSRLNLSCRLQMGKCHRTFALHS